ncbi:Fluoroacetate dehalogenase [Pseudocercospora fuligena]|uniref:Fluoroacetate dehalogenase n=1 Tax=Pseudocercospora fuligena TaxID=685502 RepID=A0A8H6RW61_9PEZI|nr:Fluoroacetate dehalogenase [Pseudocercospora fuligena]
MADQTIKSLHPFLKEDVSQVSSGGKIVSYSHDRGLGPVWCMVHGYPQSSYMWRHVVEELKDHISMFIPELPGYGFSSLPPKHDKRTVGNLIVEALQQVFGKDRPIIWCSHDRGARVGHRMVVDGKHNITSAIFMDIVPTREQWAAFANPAASCGYYHWPFLAIPTAPQMIEMMGGGNYVKVNFDRIKGGNKSGTAKFQENDAVGHYAHQFSQAECIAGSCGDYAAGAFEDCDEQQKDQDQGKKIKIPLMVIYSAGNLGRMHNVDAVWKNWIDGEYRGEAIGDGHGHYLPEECPEKVIPLILEWNEKHGK